MKVSEGVPSGRIAEVYNPVLFQEHEEVIVFAREEFNRTYSSIKEQIEYINKIAVYLDEGEDWKLFGYWPKIYERIYLLDLNMDLIFQEEPVQCYLDAYLYDTIRNSEKKIAEAGNSVSVQLKHSI